MIGRVDIVERDSRWGLREDVVEKDYVLGWVLWGIGNGPQLSETWVFKGGTCLKKCYIETYRFSEDLDFTVLENGPVDHEVVIEALTRVLDRVGQESGINFAVGQPICRVRRSEISSEGRICYIGPRNTPMSVRVKLDLAKDELLASPPRLCPVLERGAEHIRLAWWAELDERLESAPLGEGEEIWVPSQVFWESGVGSRLEPVRYAAVNHRLVILGYGGRRRLVEPYSLRRTRAGNILLHTMRADGAGHRAYRIDRIQSVSVTAQPFTPRFRIESPPRVFYRLFHPDAEAPHEVHGPGRDVVSNTVFAVLVVESCSGGQIETLDCDGTKIPAAPGTATSVPGILSDSFTIYRRQSCLSDGVREVT